MQNLKHLLFLRHNLASQLYIPEDSSLPVYITLWII